MWTVDSWIWSPPINRRLEDVRANKGKEGLKSRINNIGLSSRPTTRIIELIGCTVWLEFLVPRVYFWVYNNPE